jgi:cystathionine beta-synthase
MLIQSILEAIGNTPLVKLNRVGEGLSCNLYGKCEFLNPGGSVKDRIGYNMVMAAEKSGRIKPGDTLIEPTSGNTGIGIALAGATRGYRVIITMPQKMSREKQVVLEALGAEIVRTPTEAAWDDPDSHIGVAARLQRELPNAHILDQYSNPMNPEAHYTHTADEIIKDLGGKVDMVVVAAGTGGTLAGISRKIKEVNPKAKIIGADPVGSILAGPGKISSYHVEGIGYDFIPKVLESAQIDAWYKTNDQESFLQARRLIREEGLLVGGSSGSALCAALHHAKELGPGANCVVILPDGVRNYMTKFIDENWMREHNFLGGPVGLQGFVGDMLQGKTNVVTLRQDAPIAEAVSVMRSKGISQIPVVDGSGLVGIIHEADLLQRLSTLSNAKDLRVSSLMDRSVPTAQLGSPIATINDMCKRNTCVVVVDERKKPIGIITRIDLVEWFLKK